MKPRDFIQEQIDQLRKAADEIEIQWKQFQNGEITKEQFENGQKISGGGTVTMGYRHWLSHIKENAEYEYEDPNNGCKYSETRPDVFTDPNI